MNGNERISETIVDNDVPVTSKKFGEQTELSTQIVNINGELDELSLFKQTLKNALSEKNLVCPPQGLVFTLNEPILKHPAEQVVDTPNHLLSSPKQSGTQGSKNPSESTSSFHSLPEDNSLMEIDDPPNILTKKLENLNEETTKTVAAPLESEVSNNLHKDEINADYETKTQECIIYEWPKSKLFCTATEEFKPTKNCENYTKGCHWSPDGTCIMVPSDDFKLRIFDLPRELYYGPLSEDLTYPNYKSAVQIKEGGTIYDYCWFPKMNSYIDPLTCNFLSTSQGSPIHLWDAFTGQLRATYRAYNLVDEVEAAISVRFTNSGEQIWSGFKNALRSFDTNRSGRQLSTIFLKKDFPNVSGLVSCIREHPYMPGLIAFGTYSKCIGLYKDGPLCSLKTGNGVTQIEFGPCGNKLYSVVRRGSEFLCWDLRNPGSVLYSLENRQSDTNQRIYFDISYNGEEVISGGIDGAVRVWQISNDSQSDEDLNPQYKIKISKDCVNGVNLHKNLPLLAVSTGSRICDDECIVNRDNSLRLYWLSDRKAETCI